MNDPSVSVVIPVLNGAGTISGTLRALLTQTGAPSHEIIVVDNGSTDGIPELVAQFGVTLLHEGTRGAAAARNCGFAPRAARSSRIATATRFPPAAGWPGLSPPLTIQPLRWRPDAS